MSKVLRSQVAQLGSIGAQYAKQTIAFTLAVGVLKALPLLFPEWHAKMEEQNKDLRAAISGTLEALLIKLPRAVITRIIPGMAKLLVKATKQVVRTAVGVIRETPEGAWGVLTDLLWLIDGVVIEGLVEVVIPEAERAVTDALVPLVRWAGTEIAKTPSRALKFLRWCGSVLERAPRQVRQLLVTAFSDYFLPFATTVAREITFRPDTRSRHFLTTSLPGYARATLRFVRHLARVTWEDGIRPAPRRLLVAMQTSLEFVVTGVTRGGSALREGLWLALQSIRDAAVAFPGLLAALGSEVVALVRWLVTDGVQLLMHGLVATAVEGVPMLAGAIFNVVLGVLTVVAAMGGAIASVVTAAAGAVLSIR